MFSRRRYRLQRIFFIIYEYTFFLVVFIYFFQVLRGVTKLQIITFIEEHFVHLV